jgi:hypothetical protein
MKASPETVAKIRTAAAAGRRSKLYLWMLANLDEFSATIRDAGDAREPWDGWIRSGKSVLPQPTPDGSRGQRLHRLSSSCGHAARK